MEELQFDFRNDLDIREVTFTQNVLTYRCHDMNRGANDWLMDHKKAFNCVRQNKLAEVFKISVLMAEL